MDRRRSRYVSLIVTILLIAGFLFFHLFPLERYGELYPPCPWYYITHTYCPGCGSTRGISALFHGDLIRAFHNNSLMTIALPVLGYYYIALIAKGFLNLTIPLVRLPLWSKGGIVILVILFWILRNLVSFLAPVG